MSWGVLSQSVAVEPDFDAPTGFHRQISLAEPTNVTLEVFKATWSLFNLHWDGKPVTSCGVSLSGLVSDKEFQLNLFEDRLKVVQLGYVLDRINEKYGPTSILRAVSLTASGQARERAKKIGGHYK